MLLHTYVWMVCTYFMVTYARLWRIYVPYKRKNVPIFVYRIRFVPDKSEKRLCLLFLNILLFEF